MNRKKPVTGFSVIPYSLMNAIQDVNAGVFTVASIAMATTASKVAGHP